MITKKRDVTIFFAGLFIGLLILALLMFVINWNSFGKKEVATGDKDSSEYADVHLLDWEGVDIESAKPFIADKMIQVIAFVDEKGGFYIANKEGKKIEDWCQRDGTKIGGKCSNLTAKTFLYANQLTFFITTGSPYQMNIVNGGYSVCIDPNTGMPCQ